MAIHVVECSAIFCTRRRAALRAGSTPPSSGSKAFAPRRTTRGAACFGRHRWLQEVGWSERPGDCGTGGQQTSKQRLEALRVYMPRATVLSTSNVPCWGSLLQLDTRVRNVRRPVFPPYRLPAFPPFPRHQTSANGNPVAMNARSTSESTGSEIRRNRMSATIPVR